MVHFLRCGDSPHPSDPPGRTPDLVAAALGELSSRAGSSGPLTRLDWLSAAADALMLETGFVRDGGRDTIRRKGLVGFYYRIPRRHQARFGAGHDDPDAATDDDDRTLCRLTATAVGPRVLVQARFLRPPLEGSSAPDGPPLSFLPAEFVRSASVADEGGGGGAFENVADNYTNLSRLRVTVVDSLCLPLAHAASAALGTPGLKPGLADLPDVAARVLLGHLRSPADRASLYRVVPRFKDCT